MLRAYRIKNPLASEPAPLHRWGPWIDATALMAAVPEVVGGHVGVIGDVRAGGLAGLAVGARSVAADLHTPSGAALALSVAAIQELPIASVAALYGYDAFGRRVWFYHHVRPAMPSSSREFWDSHERLVRTGLVGCGRFERGLSRLRALPRPLRGLVRRRAIERSWGGAPRGWLKNRSLESHTALGRQLLMGQPAALGEGCDVESHTAIRAAQGRLCSLQEHPVEVLYVGDMLDSTPLPSIEEQVGTVVGWSVTARPPAWSGWHTEPLGPDPSGSPLVGCRFVLRRGNG